jgi:hypothetical protein
VLGREHGFDRRGRAHFRTCERASVGAEVVADHPFRREHELCSPADFRRVEAICGVERSRHLTVVVDDQSCDVVLDDLRDGAAAGGNHRRAARHRLDHDEAEWLLPADREERGAGALQQLDLLGVADLAQVLDSVREVWAHELVEVGLLEWLALLGGDLQRQAGVERDLDRAVSALV